MVELFFISVSKHVFVFLSTVQARKNTQLFQIDEEYNFSYQNPKET